MRAINRKLLRDISNMWGMVFVIALMIACGAATYITFLSTLDSLRQTQQSYYQEYYFANIFASLERAPNAVGGRIREIEGVNRVETRIQAGVNLNVPGFNETVTGMIISLPDEREPLLNRLYLRAGRMPHPYTEDEIVLGDGFAEEHGFSIGDRLEAILNGKIRELKIVGIGLSPEFIYQGQPGSLSPDLKRFGILWMRRAPLEAAYDMDGAFNNVVVSLTRRTSEKDVITQLDQILEPHGGLGAIAREDQNSHFFITEELNQLGQTATIIPTIFIAVAAFLLNVVIGRLIRTQREQIGILKAFGYNNREIGLHYLLMVSVIVVIGLIGGIVLGYYLGQQLSQLYASYYRFPYLQFVLNPWDLAAASLISMAAAYSGVFFSVREAAQLPPAEAMRPEPPKMYKRSMLERLGGASFLDQPTKMVLRQLGRQRVKITFGILGLAFATALMVVGRMSNDSVKYLIEVEFRQAQPFDLGILFRENISEHAVMEMKRLPGVYYGEGYRGVPVRLRSQHRSYLTAIQGYDTEMKLRRILSSDEQQVSVPARGLLLTRKLGDILNVQRGDMITVHFMDGSRRSARIPVAGFVSQYIGLNGYMNIDELSKLLPEKRVISGAYLLIDRWQEEDITETIAESPHVGEIISKQKIIERFYESTAQTWLIMALFISLFAGATAFSVVYNNARISLSERSRELASLRVLGLTRGEISYILLGELAILVLLAIPLGFLIGWGLTYFIVWSMQTELYRIPMHISTATYTLAALIVILSALLSGFFIRYKINRLDLISVLKTRE
ncbi:ABC transporter permease [Fodinibius sediminis]|uniref:Putative ABC transport system permease protein n=1 Tax=Fodinibius sediminis TaxID=1214077 RepID=A0A521BDU7_9BACT|nr:ABC transporter permease [Fodinibius sediminis]SMO45288.1 putative ABC transport system permease protein [Fodinibius sediminis]